jgi:hypothetical protein
MIPANKDEWLTGALRVSVASFAGLCIFPLVLNSVIGPMRWVEAVDRLGAQFLISYLVIGTTVVALSILCRRIQPGLARFGFWCVMVPIILPIITPFFLPPHR